MFGFWVLSSASAGIFSLGIGQRYEGELKSYAMAHAAIPYIQKILEDDDTPKRDSLTEPMLFSADLYQPQTLDNGTFEIVYEYPNRFTGYPEKFSGILDEERKLNINTADTDILRRLFTEVAGVKEKLAEAITESVLDWRDEDNDKRDFGAEKFEYLLLKKPYDCKNGPFESLEELLLVRGMTPEILKSIRPYITVYGSGKVNLNTAPDAVLKVLGLSDAGISGIMSYRLGPDGIAGTKDDPAISDLKALSAELSAFVFMEDLNLLNNLIKGDQISVVSTAFSFTVFGKLEGYAYDTRLDVVMKKDGQILSWRENSL